MLCQKAQKKTGMPHAGIAAKLLVMTNPIKRGAIHRCINISQRNMSITAGLFQYVAGAR